MLWNPEFWGSALQWEETPLEKSLKFISFNGENCKFYVVHFTAIKKKKSVFPHLSDQVVSLLRFLPGLEFCFDSMTLHRMDSPRKSWNLVGKLGIGARQLLKLPVSMEGNLGINASYFTFLRLKGLSIGFPGFADYILIHSTWNFLQVYHMYLWSHNFIGRPKIQR